MSSTTTTTSTSSPNASNTSISEPSNKDLNNMGGFISTLHNQHAGFVPMFGSSPSPLIMQTNTVFNTMIERFPMLEQELINMPTSRGYFEGTGSTPCFSQSEVDNNKGSCYLENEVFESVNIKQELTTATGEWDFEELMKDVSSFPFLDFSY
ncbi:hypothetical protein JHK85_025563 [Glycine max]|nr:hypothetical protein JHK85_025563 [Glycine max]